ncbi:MAG: THUMP domain-containing protein [Nanoarchaeota archaeon]
MATIFNSLLLRYGELFLKGKNRAFFEKKLVGNLKVITEIKKVKNLGGRFSVDFFPEHQQLKKVFGLVSYSPAIKIEKDLQLIQQKALELLKPKKGTFKITTKRSDKTFPITSLKLNQLIGEFIEKNSPLQFALTNPDTILNLEINQDGAYFFFESIPCFGGLPTGIEGKVWLLLEDQASVLAGILFLKRGCHLNLIALEEQDFSLLQQFSPQVLKLNLIKKFSELEVQIKHGVLVSGQNLENYQNYGLNLTVLRPLIAYDPNEIKEELCKFKP